MPRVPRHLVESAADGLKEPVLVIGDADAAAAAAPASPPYGSVVLVASDVAALRVLLDDLPDLGRARMVAVVVAEARAPLALRTRPTWPPLQDLDSRMEDGAAVTVAKFGSRLKVADVLDGIAYADGRPGHAGLIVSSDYDPDDKVPPDVVVGAAPVEESPVLGRAPAVVTDPGPAPLDETLFNPCGFRREWTRGVVDLDPSWTPTTGLVEALRDAQGVRVPPDADARLVAALAMSGIPLVEHGGEAVLDDPDLREQHSVRERRAALLEHSTFAWRRRLAERAGARVPAEPSVSVAPDVTGDLVLVLPTAEAPAPDLVTDLLLARRYSRADLVGAGPDPTEAYGAVVAGDPVLVDRSWCRRAGADLARLVEAVRAAGGTDYRTHG
ncbi:MAG TPA: hypothetical protein VFO49_08700 [Nocardioides sp.]|nr:hypothetical protein [Nocardioides sp.]